MTATDTTTPDPSATHHVEMLAGCDARGQPVLEKIPVTVNADGACRLLRSPAFVKGIARDDLIKLNEDTGQYEIRQRGGRLCVRVFCRGNINALAERITPAWEKLGGELDFQTPRMLVYSIHVSCGFQQIEAILNEAMDTESQWLYGNVYDPNDGVTPLNWWLDILKPQ